MKLLFIKIGKALTTLKRDGLIVGGRRIWNFAVTFLKVILSVKKGDILIVTGGVGDSAIHRAYNHAEELKFNGIKAATTIQDDPFLVGYVGKFKVFIFHRTIWTPGIAKLVEKIKKQKKEIIFETDDLVFDRKYLEQSDHFKNQMNFFERKQYENGVGGEILKDQYVKACTASTTYIADILKGYGKKVFVIKNKINQHELEVCNKIIQGKNIQNSIRQLADKIQNSVSIGYFSGTPSHNKDFATINDALVAIMQKYPNVSLCLFGPLDIENKLNDFKERIVQMPRVSRDEYYRKVASVDINVAPLEKENPFCEAKSELKFFEAGIVGIPTVAVGNRTYQEAITDGVDGYLATTTEEWIMKISELVESPELRQSMGDNARKTAIAKYTTKSFKNEEYYNYLRSRL